MGSNVGPVLVYLNAGDTIHLGVAVTGSSGNRVLFGNEVYTNITSLTFKAED
jgi:hypothetical protein